MLEVDGSFEVLYEYVLAFLHILYSTSYRAVAGVASVPCLNLGDWVEGLADNPGVPPPAYSALTWSCAHLTIPGSHATGHASLASSSTLPARLFS